MFQGPFSASPSCGYMAAHPLRAYCAATLHPSKAGEAFSIHA